MKLALYAEAGVAEVWLVLTEQRVVKRHTAPQSYAYQQLARAAFPEQLASTVLPGLALPPVGLCPG